MSAALITDSAGLVGSESAIFFGQLVTYDVPRILTEIYEGNKERWLVNSQQVRDTPR